MFFVFYSKINVFIIYDLINSPLHQKRVKSRVTFFYHVYKRFFLFWG